MREADDGLGEGLDADQAAAGHVLEQAGDEARRRSRPRARAAAPEHRPRSGARRARRRRCCSGGHHVGCATPPPTTVEEEQRSASSRPSWKSAARSLGRLARRAAALPPTRAKSTAGARIGEVEERGALVLDGATRARRAGPSGTEPPARRSRRGRRRMPAPSRAMNLKRTCRAASPSTMPGSARALDVGAHRRGGVVQHLHHRGARPHVAPRGRRARRARSPASARRRRRRGRG